ncbi:MAG: hypothetical protein MR654_06835 [Corynebacterium glucuronolyticum]|nr:hypothetical protein [Corynebacterium glucuronolyticum]
MNIITKDLLSKIATVVAVLSALGGIVAGIIAATPLNQELGTSSSIREGFDGKDTAPAPTLKDETPLRWGAWQKANDEGTQLRIFFNGDTPTCHGWRASVAETSVSVTVKLIQGTLVDAPVDCTAEGFRGSLVVNLDKPLGNRLVLQ